MIPLPARIVAIADVYDAIRISRSNKDPMSYEHAMKIIRSESGSHFDPRLLSIFDLLEDTIALAHDQLHDGEK